jgi:hypothetical protein
MNHFWSILRRAAAFAASALALPAVAGVAFFVDGSMTSTTNHNVGTVPQGAVATVGRLVSIRAENQTAGTITVATLGPFTGQVAGPYSDLCSGQMLAPGGSCTFQARVGRPPGTCPGGISTSLGFTYTPGPVTDTLGFFGNGAVWAEPTLTFASPKVLVGGTVNLNIDLRNDSGVLIDGSGMLFGAAFTLNRPSAFAQFTGPGLNACPPNFSTPSVSVAAASVTGSGALSVGAGSTCSFSVPVQGLTVGSGTFSLPQFTGVTNLGCGSAGNQSAASATLTVVDVLPSNTSVGFGNVAVNTFGSNAISIDFSAGAQLTAITPTGPYTFTMIGPAACLGTLPITFGTATTCNGTIKFSPLSVGSLPGNVTFTTATSTGVVATTGTGIGAVTLSANPNAFGVVAFGRTKTLPQTVTNGSGNSLVLSFAAPSPPFGQTYGTCPIPSMTLGSPGSCVLSNTFAPPATPTPTNPTNHTQTVTLNTGFGNVDINLTGQGNAWVDLVGLAFSPTAVNIGVPSNFQFQMQNSANFNLTGISFFPTLPAGLQIASPAGLATSGQCGGLTVTAMPGANNFSVTGSIDGTATFPTTASCTISFNVVATAGGTYGVQFAANQVTNPPFLSNPNNSPLATLVVGGGGPAAQFSPAAPLNLGNAVAGFATAQATGQVTLTNVGGSNMTLSNIVLDNPSNFLLGTAASNPCTVGQILAPGAACNISVGLKPTSAMAVSSALQVIDTPAGLTYTYSVAGTGVALAVTPATLAIGDTLLNAEKSLPVSVLSGGTTLSGITTSNGAFTFAFDAGQSACVIGAPIPAGTACAGKVTFKPTTLGTSTATLSVAGVGGPLAVALSGNGVNAFTVSPAPLSFGSVPLGGSATRTLTLTNNAGVNVLLQGYTPLAAPPNGELLAKRAQPAAPFTVAAGTCGSSLASGASCALDVTFAVPTTASPVDYGPAQGTGSIRIDTSLGGFLVQAQGRGDAWPVPAVSLSPTMVAANSPATMQITLTNTARANLTGIAFNRSFPAGLSVANPANLNLTGCGGGASVNAAPGAGSISAGGIVLDNTPLTAVSVSCQIRFDVTASAAGSYPFLLPAGSVVPAAPFAANPVDSSTVTLVATSAGTASVTASPNPLDFGSRTVGSSSSPLTVTLVNSGTLAAGIQSVSHSPTTDFSAAGGTCLAPSVSLAAGGGSCTLLYAFNPTAAGVRSSVVTVNLLGGVAPVTINLTGNGVAQTMVVVTASPASIDFGTQTVGTPGAGRTITLTNSGSVPATIASVLPTPSNEFTLLGGTCTLTVNVVLAAGGGSCTLVVSFTAQSVGARTGNISVRLTDGTAALTVALSGTGSAMPTASIAASPGSIDFGVQELGVAGAGRTVTLTNIGSEAVLISAITPMPSDEFTLGGTCAPAVTIAGGGGSCTLSIAFSPLAVGSRSGSVSVTFTNGVPAIAIPLTGSGAQARLEVKKAFDPPTVADGAESALKISITNLSGRALGALTLTDPYPSSLANSANNVVLVNDCGLALDAAPGGSRLAVTAGAIAANQQCNIAVRVRGASGLAQLPATGFAINNAIDATSIGAQLAQNGRSGDAVLDASRSQLGAVLTLTAAPRPLIQVVPNPLPAFADTPLTLSARQELTVSNVGNAPLIFSAAPAIGGTHAGDFALSQSTCGGPLAPIAVGVPGGTCQITLEFRPQLLGARNAQLTIASNDPATPSLVLPLTGTGIAFAAVVELTPNTLAFGDQVIGTSSGTRGVRLANRGNRALTIARIDASGLGDFTQSNTCGANVSPGAGCDFTFSFRPLVVGERTGEINIVDDAAGSPRRISLTGRGVAAPVPILRSDVSRLEFAPAVVGSLGQILSVVLTNAGEAPLTFVSALSLRSGNFLIVVDSCSGTALQPRGQCLVQIRFAPQQVGALTDTLLVSTLETPPVSIVLSGTGQPVAAPVLGVSPERLAFADQVVGSTSAAQDVRVSNSGNAALNIDAIALAASGNPADFVLVNECGTTLPPSGSCRVQVRFAPTATGLRQATLSVRTPAVSGGRVDVSLSGTGLPVPAARLELSATQLAFGNRLLGALTPFSTLTLRNVGGLALSVSKVDVFGDFAMVNECSGRSVQPSSSCAVQVGFYPTVLGARQGELQITSNGATGITRVPLSGTGCAPFSILGYRLAVLNCSP